MRKAAVALMLAVSMVFSVVVVAPSYAKQWQMSINKRIKTQQQRINDGRRTGKLTPREADIVQDNLDYVRRQRAKYKSDDGALGPGERKRLHEMLDENSDLIYRKKHNFRRLY